MAQMAIVGEEYCDGEGRELTVRKTCLFSPGDGLAAYDHRTGALAFRVETYGRGGQCGAATAAGDLAVLGPAGEPVLTLRRRRPSLHNRWDGFRGARANGQKPIFSARRSSILGAAAAAVLVEILSSTSFPPPSPSPSPSPSTTEFRVDGSFPRRCCRLVATKGAGGGEEEVVVAEVRRKVDEGSHVVMGRDVFVLWVRAGFDAAFAMGIVLVLDRITGDEVDGDVGEELLEAN